MYNYHPILSFPQDIVAALEGGELSLFEAEQLARLTARRLGVTASSARSERARLLRAHLASQEPYSRLRARVSALLDQSEKVRTRDAALHSTEFSPEILRAAAELEAKLAAASLGAEGEDPAAEADPGHIFFDHLRLIAEALREARPEDLTDEVLARLYASGD